jgi:hypothetical protein
MSTPTPVIKTDSIWFKQLNVLFSFDRITEFVPVSEQSLEERMNSIARFGLYVAILITIYKRDFIYLAIFPATLVFTYFIYKKYKTVEESFGEKIQVEKKEEDEFRKPTLNNPFMNPIVTDKPDDKQAIEYYQDTKEAEDIRKDINDKFKHDLYMGIDDVYEKNNSQRQFYTIPNTQTPSDQEKFLKFMYPDMTSCKSNARDCKINEDLRGRPYIFPEQENSPTV